uniref:Serpentine receptor class gamma n=1 Tax=Steinernema glaseri TaxID=37863 RepID=A0A1I7ZL33_9BILA
MFTDLPSHLIINYGIQFLCASVTLVLNPATLYNRLAHKRKNDQFSMLLVHIVLHLLFACSTVLWAAAVLLQFAVLWMIPAVVKTVMEYGFAISVTWGTGPITLTQFAMYVAACSVLYWFKMTKNRITSRETT